MDPGHIDIEAVREFDVNYSKFDRAIRGLELYMKSTSHQMTIPNESEIRAYFHCCFDIYARVNLHRYGCFLSNYDWEGFELLKRISDIVYVPIVFRDMFREMARPMRYGAEMWIPKVKYLQSETLSDVYLEYGGDWDTLYTIQRLLHKLEFSLVKIEKEIIKPTNFGMYHPGKGILITAKPLSNSRIEAMGRLKFLQFEEVDVSKMTHSEFITFIRTLSVVKGTTEMAESGYISVNGVGLYSCTPSSYEFGIISPLRTFPTEEDEDAKQEI
ncbi:hypothetical protein DAKH74_048630 [Maudiozyma humilis]|uniref:Uncharacterized protein n=1 Tax=Maudiozyma humilis TaxID=51915 RepID=A0AAV5S3Q4_MAUHU|nr:hypothetical protein DAKH74_017000 [Kazachstania humilis]GMM58247.1 hypothetical protein DAKH74_048630 [Kazachstania humilis]